MELPPGLLSGWKGPKFSDYLGLLSQAHWQEVRPEVEHQGLELGFVCDVDIAHGSLTHI